MCDYTAALSLLPKEMKINTNNYNVLILKKCQQLHAELRPYRESLCQEATDRFGQDIALLLGVCLSHAI